MEKLPCTTAAIRSDLGVIEWVVAQINNRCGVWNGRAFDFPALERLDGSILLSR